MFVTDYLDDMLDADECDSEEKDAAIHDHAIANRGNREKRACYLGTVTQGCVAIT